ncbi:MAG: hypothetical protein LC539_17030, partial [Candidatus Thiodiazotropha sp.]|nr:hypothetical protein [Candidatus Thiodiazotropha sp.]
VTEGILTRRLQHDPELQGVGLIIFDEFHGLLIDTKNSEYCQKPLIKEEKEVELSTLKRVLIS